MSKTAVKELSCSKCGAEIREAALFCYGCGTSVEAVADEAGTNLPIEAVKDGVNRAANDQLIDADVPSEIDVSKAASPAETAMPSAAAIRRRSRREPAKPIKVEWQPKQGFSISFIVGTILFAFLALLIISAALYLR